MDIPEILVALAHEDRKFPREALEQAIAKKDEIRPHLLKILEEVASHPDEILEQKSAAYFYALYLLAQFREKQAYPLIVKIASLPPKTVDALLGDTITAGLPKILASVCGGDVSLITQLAENRSAENFVRFSALRSLLALVISGDKSREEVMNYYASLFEGKLEKDDDQVVWSGLVGCATDLYPEEVYDKINQAFAEGLIDEVMINPGEVDRQLDVGKEATLDQLRKNPHLQLIESAIEDMKWWAWYENPAKKNPKDISSSKSFFENPPLKTRMEEKTQMPIRVSPKVGRNDPCPCGSGKKYKKCHGA
jgi:Protein of unknown function (DUF1186)/SEC-C motif